MVWIKVNQKVTGKRLRLVISHLQYGCILGAKVHILMIDCHLKFGNCEVLGWEKLC